MLLLVLVGRSTVIEYRNNLSLLSANIYLSEERSKYTLGLNEAT